MKDNKTIKGINFKDIDTIGKLHKDFKHSNMKNVDNKQLLTQLECDRGDFMFAVKFIILRKVHELEDAGKFVEATLLSNLVPITYFDRLAFIHLLGGDSTKISKECYGTCQVCGARAAVHTPDQYVNVFRAENCDGEVSSLVTKSYLCDECLDDVKSEGER